MHTSRNLKEATITLGLYTLFADGCYSKYDVKLKCVTVTVFPYYQSLTYIFMYNVYTCTCTCIYICVYMQLCTCMYIYTYILHTVYRVSV